MKLTIEVAATGLMLIASSACVVLEPGGGSVQDPDAAVSFSGYALVPYQRVELESRNAGGAFQTFASTEAKCSATVLDDGTHLYPWNVAAVVPNWTGSGCDSVAEVRAVGVVGQLRQPLFTFDEAGAQCVSNALDAGTPFMKAAETCAAELNSTLKLRGGSAIITGDVVITTQAEADALACATTLDGNLTVRPAAPIVHLPNLEQVTGNVLIEVEDALPSRNAEQADLPALRTIGGNLQFHHLNGASTVTVDVGLPALTSLSGDLELLLSSFNGYNSGPANLQSVAGDVSILATGDFYGNSVLTSLETVGGDLAVASSGAGSSGNILESLKTVGGSVTVQRLGMLSGPVLAALQSVGGDMTVKRCAWASRGFAALRTVLGTLLVEGTGSSAPPRATLGSDDISIGALELSATHFTIMPLSATSTVGPQGAITIVNNESLCQSTVDTFVARQLLADWSGALTVSGNTGSCTP